MRRNRKWFKDCALLWLSAFIVWTVLIQVVDVQCVGPKNSSIGFATMNVRVHNATGVHMTLYTVTDWLGLVPVGICLGFGIMGLIQWIKRGHILQVDKDIILLGIYYVAVIAAYLLFEMIPINYRPVLIHGALECSYPSSTTLLVLCVMPTVIFQAERRMQSRSARNAVKAFVIVFSVFTVIGRTVSGVHWLTDILGAVFLSRGLFALYRGAVGMAEKSNRITG